MSRPTLTIIIPTLNEGANIGTLIGQLQLITKAPIWIANSPNTTDDTAAQALALGAKVVECPKAGRAPQMNYAAQQAKSDLLYFVHADTIPPSACCQYIKEALQQGADFGYFSYRFNADSFLLRCNSLATRFDGLFAGGGDQTLFVKREVFIALGGFDESLRLMEDFDLVRRAKRQGYKHVLIPKDALVSARKYEKNSWLRVNLVNLWVFMAFFLGASQEHMIGIYRRYLRW